MRFFPNTSVVADLNMDGMPDITFSGLDLQDTDAFGIGARVGFQYRKGALRLGGAYFTETSLDLDGGTMEMNMSAMGLGIVEYDAEIDGFNWPQQVGLGMGYQITPSFLIAADVDWVNWSSAIQSLTIEIDDPDHRMAPSSQEIPFQMDWEDQWVYAVGAEVTPAEDWAVRFGFNHGDTPIPADRLRPLFPAIGEDHVTAGFGVTKGPWTFDLGLEYVLEADLTNNSSDPAVNPFGPGSEETLSQFMAHFLVRRTLG
jgi:long-chain fatty acid transport protein